MLSEEMIQSKIIGDPLEIKMFEASGWKINNVLNIFNDGMFKILQIVEK